MIKVCVAGACGRMGSLLADLVNRADDLQLVGALERPGHSQIGTAIKGGVNVGDDAEKEIASADVLLDFSLADSVCEHLLIASQLNIPVVTGTTGFSKQQTERFEEASRKIAIVLSSNMSRGVHVLKNLVLQAARQLLDYDVEIVEIHHRNKQDSPSGTATLLAETIALTGQEKKPVVGRSGKRHTEEIGLASVRGGDVVGEHQVMFLGAGEQVILTHRATSREHFCTGALAAVRFVVRKKKGLFGMQDVFGEVV